MDKSLGRDPMTGKAHYRTKGMRATKRQAQRALAERVTEVDNGRAARSAKSVGHLLGEWLEHLESQGRSPTTLHGYRSLCERLPAPFLGMPLRKVDPRVLDELHRRLGEKEGRSPATVRHFHAMLRTALNQAVRWEMLDRRSPSTPGRSRP